MRTIRLEIEHIHTVRALHIYLAYRLDLPAYYGRNLDALHDALSEESDPLRIVLAGKPASEEMAAYMPRLERVLRDCAQENGRICFERA